MRRRRFLGASAHGRRRLPALARHRPHDVDGRADGRGIAFSAIPSDDEPVGAEMDNIAEQFIASLAEDEAAEQQQKAAAEPDYDPEQPPISMFDVDAQTVSNLAAKGITHFTPIQAQSFDLLRSGKDMLGRSRTGTGKTLAFSLPLVQKLAAENAEGGDAGSYRGRPPRMLVLAPTRELAKQVGDVINSLCRPHRLMTATFTGGTPYPPQQRALRNGIDILIGTPGRIIDHLENGELDLTRLMRWYRRGR